MGWIAAESSKTYWVAPSEEIEIVLLPAYGARIQILDAAGLPVEDHSGLEPSLHRGVIGGTRVPGALPVVAGAGAILAGVPPEALESDPTSELWVFVWNQEADTLGPVECEVHISDHAPHRSLVVLPRLSSYLESIPIRLGPAEDDWVPVRLEFYDETTGEAASMAPTGRMVLKSKDREFTFRTSSTDAPIAQFSVPRAIYGARFRATAGIWTQPPLESPALVLDLSLGAASLRIPVDSLGSLEILPGLDSDLHWVRQIQIVLAPEAKSDPVTGQLEFYWDSSIGISGPPFRLDGVRAGTYTLIFLEPSTSLPQASPVEIVFGSTTQLWIR